MQTGVIDEPLSEDQDDKLGVQEYADALFQFIMDTQTPMTIGVQGDWGSGKTSLMNQMWYKFENPKISSLRTKQIWVNTWEHSLLKTPQEALVSIISEIITNLSAALGDEQKKIIRHTASKVLQGTLKIGASLTAGVEGVNVVNEFFDDDRNANSISNLRHSLNKLVEENSEKKYDRFVVYIDDLDRLEPSNAVEILELLKNIFNIKNCVFILAIDYNVVVKGLAKKFGALNKENRWEYDAFFHKIIQLTFQMPINNYDIGNYLSSLLIDTGFVKAGELNQKDLSKLTQITIGGNPRSIKRLVNNIALNNIFIEVKKKHKEDALSVSNQQVKNITKFLLVALNCIQIQYPKVYDALVLSPDFINWEEEFAEQSLTIEDDEALERDLNNYKKNNDDAVTWQVVLFKICHPEPRLRARFKDISDTLLLLQRAIGHQNEFSKIMQKVVEQTKVTNTGLTDIADQTKAYHQMENLETKLSQLAERGYNSSAIKAVAALMEPSVNAAKINQSIFVSLKENACVIYKVDEDTTKREQWLYLKNPTKKSPGIHFSLKDRSGLSKSFSDHFAKNDLPADKLEEHTPRGHEGIEYTKNIADAVGKDKYCNIIGDLGELIKQEIIKRGA
ncbi:KAP family NTPase [bacterium]|nr:KAP family NTPase [bacterium]